LLAGSTLLRLAAGVIDDCARLGGADAGPEIEGTRPTKLVCGQLVPDLGEEVT